jgi:hypothetical protein
MRRDAVRANAMHQAPPLGARLHAWVGPITRHARPILVNYIVGSREHSFWNRHPESLHGFGIDYQLKFRWLFYREIARLCTLQYPIDKLR